MVYGVPLITLGTIAAWATPYIIDDILERSRGVGLRLPFQSSTSSGIGKFYENLGDVHVLDGRSTILKLAGRAIVTGDSHIDSIEQNLAPVNTFTGRSHWEIAYRKWLEEGATIDLFVNGIHPHTHGLMKELAHKYTGLTIFDYTGVRLPSSSGGEVTANFLRNHMTIIHNPDQYWFLEDGNPGFTIDTCNYVPPEKMNRRANRANFQDTQEIVDLLRDRSPRMTL